LEDKLSGVFVPTLHLASKAMVEIVAASISVHSGNSRENLVQKID